MDYKVQLNQQKKNIKIIKKTLEEIIAIFELKKL